jgi:DNA-binding ferritin-like protein
VISTTRSENLLNLLSRVLLDNEYRKAFSVRGSDTSDGLRSLSCSHHVVIRAFRKLLEAATQADDRVAADWLATEISKEEARIHNAVSFLDAIVRTLNDKGCPAM